MASEKGGIPPSLLDEPNRNPVPQRPITPTRNNADQQQQQQQQTLSSSFTPRSASFPDHDSDSEFNDHPQGPFTPEESHHGGDDDLPPSYEEAQAQARESALGQARSDLRDLDLRINRMVLGPTDSPTPVPEAAQQAPPPGHEEQPPQYRTSRGNVSREGIPVQQPTPREGSTNIPVHQISSSPLTTAAALEQDPGVTLLNQALEFARNQPDADARYAPRLSRKIAIPTEVAESSTAAAADGDDAIAGGGLDRRSRGKARATSHDSASAGAGRVQKRYHLKFARCYSKALHSHSISPAEFVAFLDGLNVISRLDPAEPTTSSYESSLIAAYLERSNATFFAPRGLKVRLSALRPLLESLNVSEARGQRAAVLSNILSKKDDAERKATAIEPYAEPITFDVPGPGSQTIALQTMGESLAAGSIPVPTEHLSHPPPSTEARARPEPETEEFPDDPPVSVPGAFPESSTPLPPRGGGPPQRSQTSQSWAEWGAEIGNKWERWGNDFGKRMEKWGEDLGKRAEEQANTFGRNVETRADAFSRRATGEGEASSSSSSRPCGSGGARGWGAGWGSGWGPGRGAGGVHVSAPGVNVTVPGFGAGHPWGRGHNPWGRGAPWGNGAPWGRGPPWTAAWGPYYHHGHNGVEQHHNNQQQQQQQQQHYHHHHHHDEHTGQPGARTEPDPHDDDDKASVSSFGSSSSSDSSSSSSSSDSDSDYDPEKRFIEAVRDINEKAQEAHGKGKRNAEQIEEERVLRIQKAEKDKTKAELKYERKRQYRAIKRDARAIKRGYRQEYREQKRNRKKENRKAVRGLRPLGKKTNEYKEQRKKIKEANWEERRKARGWWRERMSELNQWRSQRKKDVEENIQRGIDKPEDDDIWLVVENLED